MSNQNPQNQQIKEIFKLTNFTSLEASQNRNILRQLRLKTDPIKPQPVHS